MNIPDNSKFEQIFRNRLPSSILSPVNKDLSRGILRGTSTLQQLSDFLDLSCFTNFVRTPVQVPSQNRERHSLLKVILT